MTAMDELNESTVEISTVESGSWSALAAFGATDQQLRGTVLRILG